VHEALAFIGVNEGMPWLVTHNGALADASARLHYGDTLVIIPPISGGIF
jgi:molybdopterin converting factor small subunit